MKACRYSGFCTHLETFPPLFFVFDRNLKRITSGRTRRPSPLLETAPCLWRSSLKSRDTLKCKSSVSGLNYGLQLSWTGRSHIVLAILLSIATLGKHFSPATHSKLTNIYTQLLPGEYTFWTYVFKGWHHSERKGQKMNGAKIALSSILNNKSKTCQGKGRFEIITEWPQDLRFRGHFVPKCEIWGFFTFFHHIGK